MKQFSIDRFEGQIAILIDEEGKKASIRREDLPQNAVEGDVLYLEGEKFVKNPSETDQKRAEVQSLIDELFQ